MTKYYNATKDGTLLCRWRGCEKLAVWHVDDTASFCREHFNEWERGGRRPFPIDEFAPGQKFRLYNPPKP